MARSKVRRMASGSHEDLRKSKKVCFKKTKALYSSQASLNIFRNHLPDPDQDLAVQVCAQPTFQLFNKLPIEVRSMVWRLCLPSRRSVDLSARCYKTPTSNVPIYSSLLRVSKESRQEILRKYIQLDHPLTSTIIIPRHLHRARRCSGVLFAPRILFSPGYDRLTVDMSFDKNTNTLSFDGYDGDLVAAWFIRRFTNHAKKSPSIFRGVKEVEFLDWYGDVKMTLTPGVSCLSVEQAWHETITRVWIDKV